MDWQKGTLNWRYGVCLEKKHFVCVIDSEVKSKVAGRVRGMEKAGSFRDERVYQWADGIYVKAGLEKDRAALLIIVGALLNC